MMIAENIQFIETVEMIDIPWDRLMTAHGTAKIFPELFAEILRNDQNKIKNAIYKIFQEIDHQDTIFQATPFAMIFLAKILNDSIISEEIDEVVKYRIQELLNVFIMIEKSCLYQLELVDQENFEEIENPVYLFSDMLKEEYLLPNNWDVEKVDTFSNLPEDFDSYIYYTHGVLVNCKNIINILSINNDNKIKISAKELYSFINKH